MFRLISLMLFWGVFFASKHCYANEIFIVLFYEAEVVQAEVKLSEITTLQSEDPVITKALGEMVVTHCVSFVPHCVVNKSDIVKAIEEASSKFKVNVLWGSNDKTIVYGRPRQVSLSSLSDQVAIEIARTIGKQFPFILSIQKNSEKILVPPGKLEAKPDFSQISKEGEEITLPVDIWVKGTFIKKVSLQYSLKNISDSFFIEEQELVKPNNQSVSQVTKPKIKLSKTKRGDEKKDSFLVKKNSPVNLLVESGPIRIESKGVLLTDAKPGERVKVSHLDENVELEGLLVDQQTVLIKEN